MRTNNNGAHGAPYKIISASDLQDYLCKLF
jgi:hypothetical protein